MPKDWRVWVSTSQPEPAERQPRWAHYYLVHGLAVDDAARKVSEATGLVLRPRESSFVGRYFLYHDAELEFQVKLNWIDDEDELVHPHLPEGVIIACDGVEEDQFASQLESLPEVEFLRKRRYR